MEVRGLRGRGGWLEMKLIEFPASVVAQEGTGEAALPESQWQTAGDRVLLYLRSLGLPAPLALELALGALRAAEQEGAADPVAGAMQALRKLLSKKAPSCRYPVSQGQLPSRAAPPVHRLPMVSEEIFSKTVFGRRKNGNGARGPK